MQALAVLLLEISYRATYEQRDIKDMSKDVQKLIMWLYSMRSTNPVADRAFEVISDIVRKGSPNSFGEIAQRLPRNTTVPSTEPATHFNHPYLHSDLEIPDDPTPRFQPNEWDPIEWNYLDAQPEQMQQTIPFTMPSLKQLADVGAPSSIMGPMYLASNTGSSTYAHSFLAEFDRPDQGLGR